MTRKTMIATFAAAVALAGQLFAGGFYLQLGNPEASPEARKHNAVLTVMATGCHDPGSAQLTANAIGVVNGERKSIPLTVTKLSTPGMFALTQQWPKEGRWVLDLTAKNDEQFTNTLVKVGPDGIDRLHPKWSPKQFAASDIEAMLQD